MRYHWLYAPHWTVWHTYFPVMQYVKLDDNQLTGTIPDSWFKQGMMRQLSLSNNTGLT